MKSNEDFRKALGEPDEYFESAVLQTLDRLNQHEESESRLRRNYTARFACAFAALVLVISGAVLSARHLTDGRVDAVNPTPAAQAGEPESFTHMETDLVSVSLKQAETDGFGVFLSFEITPKNEKTLIIGPFRFNSRPEEFGLASDREDQTLFQWADEHEYTLLEAQIFSPANESGYEANCHPYLRSYTPGSATLNVYGGVLPDTDRYRLYCRFWVRDPGSKDIPPQETENGSSFSYENWKEDNFGYINVAVTGEAEAPEILAEYCVDTGEAPDLQESDVTVSFFRTSRAEYMEIRSQLHTGLVYQYWRLDAEPFFMYDDPTPIKSYVTEEGRTILTRETLRLTGSFPDAFNLTVMGRGKDETDFREIKDPPFIPVKRIR
jgi:hypothetical protein